MAGAGWLSTVEVAALAGVAPSSVKRWADEGALLCEKTAGGHRRFQRMDVERFLSSQRSAQPAAGARAQAWVDAMLSSDEYGLLGALYTARSRQGAWHRVADEVGLALTLLGAQWAEGQVSVLEEHAASERLHRALAQVAAALGAPSHAPRALLITVGDEDHTLGLSLAELCLKEAAFGVVWAGRRTPVADIVRHVERGTVQMVAASASVASPARVLQRGARELSHACRAQGVSLVMGGSGPWPERLAGALRVTSFGEFSGLLASFPAARS